MSEFRPCNKCEDWRTCLLTDDEKHWFGYQHIRFCPHHIFFLLKYEHDIRGRSWPMPDNTALGGFTNTTLSEAAWAKVSLILAELDARLDQCKPSLKGELLRSQCKEEKREKVEYLSNDARDALYYIARWDRIKTPFAVWLAQRDSKNGYKKYTHAKKVRS